MTNKEITAESLTPDNRFVSELVIQGDMERITQLYGHPYTIKGTVVHGQALGRTLGYPTINLGGEADLYVSPKPGIYFGTSVILEGDRETEQYNAIISAGNRPTVGGESYFIEAFLLDYSGDLYGRKVLLEFLKYVREEITFENLDQLMKQMKLDENHAKWKTGFHSRNRLDYIILFNLSSQGISRVGK
ncbi:riboflavin kinase [Paenibacillus urinalis]|uniref:riboflavin kinase n=1 Tax=Paenibacillus urinalis TaxID=521520 RepID=A0ABY7X2X6_9BACL|nr:riboflavin kinase [Paenibacillus urinalis]WDI00201.1 riboflavin kinase [Paenibacillus urinalis]